MNKLKTNITRSRKISTKSLKKGFIKLSNKSIKRLRIAYMEINLRLHLFIRLIHDKLYNKNGRYKKWTDKSYSEAVHKATLTGFVASFLVFGILQYAMPSIFDMLRPNEVRAGSSSKTWTTNGDFTANVGTTGTATTKNSIFVSGAIAGDDANVTLSSPEPNFETTSLSSGPNFHLAIKTDGTLWSWGWNGNGQLGQGTSDAEMTHNTPVQVGSGTNWKMVSAGGTHAVAIKADGSMWSWGNNYSGQLGIGSNVSQLIPTRIGVGTTWKYVSAGEEHTIAIKSDGTIWSWGNNSYGQLGQGTTDTATNHINPVKIGTGTSWKTVSTRDYHVLAVKTDGTLWSWGRNNYGQLGQGTSDTTTTHNYPVQVGASNLWKIISSGFQYSLGIKSDGTLWSWGHNDLGKLGQGTSDGGTTHNTPIQVGSDTTWGVVMAGQNHAIATKSDGTLWSWGTNGSGQLALGDTVQRNTPVRIGSGTTWKFISVPSYSTYAIRTDGTFWSCGYNGYGNLGQGTTDYVAHNQLTQVGVNTGWHGVTVSYPAIGTIGGLRIDAGSANRHKWNTLIFTGNTPLNTSIDFQTRGSDDGATWSSLAPLSSTSIQTASSRYLEIQVLLSTGDTAQTPTLNDFTITYDSLEAPINSNLTLKRTDNTLLKTSAGADVAAGVSGAWSNSTVRIEASGLACTDCGVAATNLRPEVEAKPLGTEFSGTNTAIAISGNNYVDVSGLTNGVAYHLQIRAVDDQGRASAWVPYGNNSENVADVSIDQFAPAGSLTIGGPNVLNGFARSTTVALASSASDTGGSGLSQMQFSNDNIIWSGWESYSPSPKSWSLSTGDGAKTVYTQFRDNAGNVSGFMRTVTTDFTGTKGAGVSALNDELKLYNDPSSYFTLNEPFSPALEANAPADDNMCMGGGNSSSTYTVPGATSVRVTWSSYGSHWQESSSALYVGGILASSKIGTGSYITNWITGNTVRVEAGYDYCYEDSWAGVSKIEYKTASLANVSPDNQYSEIVDRGLIKSFTSLSWSDNTPSGTSLVAAVRASNSADASGGMGWEIVTKGQLFSELSGWQDYRYLQYRFTLGTDAGRTLTPVVYDASLSISSMDTVNLDTVPSPDVAGLAAYTDAGKASPILDTTWNSVATPYFEWTPNVSDTIGYKYCFGTASCDPVNNVGVASKTLDLSNQGTFPDNTYYMRVVAYDAAGNTSLVPAQYAYKLDRTTPGAVTGFSASQIYEDHINLNWSAIYDTNGSPITYTVERIRHSKYLEGFTINDIGPGKIWSDQVAFGYASYTGLTGASYSDALAVENQGIKFVYRIKAVDASGKIGPYQAAAVYGLTRDGINPTTPHSVTAVACSY